LTLTPILNRAAEALLRRLVYATRRRPDQSPWIERRAVIRYPFGHVEGP